MRAAWAAQALSKGSECIGLSNCARAAMRGDAAAAGRRISP
jgi:hypothetical protein